MVATFGIAAVSVAGGWWLLQSTVPASDYNNVAAELEATVVELNATNAALESAQEALSAEVPSASAYDTELRSRFGQARSAALLLGYFSGANPKLVTGQEWDTTWAGVVARDGFVDDIGDPVLTDLYWEYIDGDVGEPLEAIELNEFIRRLAELTIEPIIRGH